MIGIIGLGGIGKTALAQEVVDKAKGQFQHVVWISPRVEQFEGERVVARGTNQLAILELYGEIGRQCGRTDIVKLPPEQQKYAVQYLLNQQPTLIVLDNWETIQPDREGVLRDLYPLLGQGKLFFTSRHLPLFEKVTLFTLTGLSQVDGLAFLREEAYARGETTIAQAPQATLLQIWKTTGGSPLAMKLVVGQATYLSLDKVLNKLQQATDNYEFYHFLFWDSWQLLDDKSKLVLVDMSRFPPNTGGARPQIEKVSPIPPIELWTVMKKLVLMSLVDKSGLLDKERYALHPLTQYFIKSDIIKEWQ